MNINLNYDKKIALLTVIEGNMNNINFDKNKIRLYELEAIRCFKHWRKNAGILKDIDIYCICVSKNKPSQSTIDKMKKLNVNYIEKYDSRSSNFTCGFWNKPLGCSILENKLNYDYFIHIDLDMYIIKEIKKDVFCNSCLVYDKFDKKEERQFKKNKFIPFNTCYITTVKKDKIFTKWFDLLLNFDKLNLYKHYSNLTENKIEEAGFDIFSYIEKNNIKQIEDIMFGDTYTPLSKMATTSEISFHHYHIYAQKINQKYNYIEMEKEFNNL